MFRVPLLCMVGIVVCFCSNVTAQEFLPPPPSISVEGYTDQLSYAPGEVVKFQLLGTAPTDALIDAWELNELKSTNKRALLLRTPRLPFEHHRMDAIGRWCISLPFRRIGPRATTK